MFDATLAYLDPGAGSILIQVVVGAMCGMAYFLRSGFKPIKDWFRSRKQTSA